MITEARDAYTAGHQQKVSKLAIAISQKWDSLKTRLKDKNCCPCA